MTQKKIVANDILVTEIARLVNEGSQVTFVPKGVSMLPFIRGERDSVMMTTPQDLAPLDIVLAKVGTSYVLHRIIKIDGDRLTLMGDGNIAGVEYCRIEDVLAKATVIIKDGREIDCTGSRHRRKAAIWKALLPIRRYILAVYRRVFKYKTI